jgi:hypothetical protein
LESKLDGHLLAARLREDEKNKVIDMTKSLGLPRNIQMDLKERKKTKKFDEYNKCTMHVQDIESI